jgi:ketosteroid isomerase-like protein
MEKIMKMSLWISLTLIFSLMFLVSCESAPTTTNNAKPANAPAANAPANAAAAPAASSATAQADIKKLVDDLYVALSKNDTAALEKYYADDYVFVSIDGEMMNRSDRLAQLKSGELKIVSLQHEEPKIRVYGDTAVVNMKIKQTVNLKGKESSGSGSSTIVFVKSKDGWRIVNGQAAIKADAK